MAGVIECPFCGSTFPSGTRFCSECGATMTGALVRQATGMLPANRMLQDRYLILKKLAQGGQSAVYLVADTLDGSKQYALKEMSESELSPAEKAQALADFQREADMLRLLNHPALARVYGTFVEETRHYMLMEYIAGRTLEAALAEAGKPLPEAEVVAWGIALCDLLAYLHRQDPQIIYRDLKPSNIILKPDNTIKLIDFGIARFQQTGQSKDTVCLGTDGYAPIEQYSGKTEPRSDLYALGATLYHLLTNQVPAAAPTRIADTVSFVSPRTHNPALSPEVEAVLLHAMEVHLTKRYVDADEMREALQAISDDTISVPAAHSLVSRPSSASLPSGSIAPADAASPADAPSRPLPMPVASSSVISSGQERVTIRLQPARAPRWDGPKLRVRPPILSFGIITPRKAHAQSLILVNEGAEPLEVTISSSEPALLLDVPAVQGHRAQVAVWLKPFQLEARHYERTLEVVTATETTYVEVQFTVARPGTASNRLPVPVQQNRQVYFPRPGRLIGLGIGLAWLLSYLLSHLGHAGPFIGH
jgi:serine/threonine protein kinase